MSKKKQSITGPSSTTAASSPSQPQNKIHFVESEINEFAGNNKAFLDRQISLFLSEAPRSDSVTQKIDSLFSKTSLIKEKIYILSQLLMRVKEQASWDIEYRLAMIGAAALKNFGPIKENENYHAALAKQAAILRFLLLIPTYFPNEMTMDTLKQNSGDIGGLIDASIKILGHNDEYFYQKESFILFLNECFKYYAFFIEHSLNQVLCSLGTKDTEVNELFDGAKKDIPTLNRLTNHYDFLRLTSTFYSSESIKQSISFLEAHYQNVENLIKLFRFFQKQQPEGKHAFAHKELNKELESLRGEDFSIKLNLITEKKENILHHIKALNNDPKSKGTVRGFIESIEHFLEVNKHPIYSTLTIKIVNHIRRIAHLEQLPLKKEIKISDFYLSLNGPTAHSTTPSASDTAQARLPKSALDKSNKEKLANILEWAEKTDADALKHKKAAPKKEQKIAAQATDKPLTETETAPVSTNLNEAASTLAINGKQIQVLAPSKTEFDEGEFIEVRKNKKLSLPVAHKHSRVDTHNIEHSSPKPTSAAPAAPANIKPKQPAVYITQNGQVAVKPSTKASTSAAMSWAQVAKSSPSSIATPIPHCITPPPGLDMPQQGAEQSKVKPVETVAQAPTAVSSSNLPTAPSQSDPSTTRTPFQARDAKRIPLRRYTDLGGAAAFRQGYEIGVIAGMQKALAYAGLPPEQYFLILHHLIKGGAAYTAAPPQGYDAFPATASIFAPSYSFASDSKSLPAQPQQNKNSTAEHSSGVYCNP